MKLVSIWQNKDQFIPIVIIQGFHKSEILWWLGK